MSHGFTGLIALLAILAAGCGAPATPGADADGSRDARGGDPLGEPAPPQPVPLELYLRQGALAAGLDRAGTIDRLGAPDSTSARSTTNRHDPQVVDSIVTLHYPGARYVFYVVTRARRDLLDLAVIESDAHLRHAAPGIGSPVDSVRAWLGEPLAERPGAIEYDCLTCEVPLPVTFEIENGRVRRILFDYYVD